VQWHLCHQSLDAGDTGLSRCRDMRRLIIGSLSVLLMGCNPTAPSEIRVSLNSDKVLGVSNFKFEPANEYSGCSVSALIDYDIKVEPANFTGLVLLDKFVIEYAGKWRSRPTSESLTFVKGKIVGGGLFVSEYTTGSDELNEKEKIEAICASKSSSDIKIASLGTAQLALPGIKAVVVEKK
jgi:hypothetical protein